MFSYVTSVFCKIILNQKQIICAHQSGHLERNGSEVVQNKSSKEIPHLQDGYSHALEEKLSSDIHGGVVDPHQQLLVVLSNIGYCKDELSYELYNKYKHIWLQSR